MIREPVLIDTGPLVALLHGGDRYHSVCTTLAAELVGPVYTSWPVVTEAAWLLRGFPDGLPRLMQLVSANRIQCLHLDETAIPWLSEVAARYRDLAPQLADMSLLYLGKQLGTRRIFTLDRRDFTVYRTEAGEPLQLLPEALD